MEFMAESAPLVILTFLGTCFALGAIGLVIVYGLARGKPTLAKYAGIVALGGAAVYAGLLLAVRSPARRRYFSPVSRNISVKWTVTWPTRWWISRQPKRFARRSIKERRRNILCGEGEDVVR